MQAVVDEIVIANVNPAKVFAVSNRICYYIGHFVSFIVLFIFFWQHPSTWSLNKLLEELFSISGKLLDGEVLADESQF